ncbi:hypothetical protein [Streptomyces sp. RKAG337]|uniref:hypothetical protein n=1 Tax=Streptomyces sp. RKAG337 TaxID=2893404 RepID=UPI002033D36B|nr:hypothetical protein [Streptomyces sp. RKAG337]MCM2427396.1 hypothetical protein [Streptomyces sp. RKAG337]
MNEVVGIVGAVVTVVGMVITGWMSLRGTRAAAAITAAGQERSAAAAAAPAVTAANFAVLQATVDRVDEENAEIRTELRGLRALVRAYSWTVDRLIAQIRRGGTEPEELHDLVKEHMRTGA